MKHGTILIFRHNFGQLVEDNVEHEDLRYEYSIGHHAQHRTEFFGEKKPREIDPAVMQWRLDSLAGRQGEKCPTKKIVLPRVSDEELMARRGDLPVTFCTPEEMHCPPAPPPGETFNLASFAAAMQEWAHRRDEFVRQHMIRYYEARIRRYTVEDLQAGLWRPTIQPEQAFAMLGGYRPDRHFAYSGDCVLIPPVEPLPDV